METINLRTSNSADRVALRGVRVHAVLAAMSQKTVVEQQFINRERHAIEAVYTFPLPEGAAVCGFEVITGDRVLTGIIEETDNAIEKYESAVAAGDAAYLAEQERPDVFTIRVGNIKPQQSAVIRMTYICPLEINDCDIRVAFPTTVAPRYITDAGMDPVDAAIDGDALNPPHVLSVPYGLTFSADVQLGRKVKSITSSSHSIRVTGDDQDGYHVTIPAPAVMDGDVVFDIVLAREFGPSIQVENGKDNQSYLAVTFVPEFEPNPAHPAASETIFVLDCSGSMAGQSIEQATAALELCLRTLNLGDTFNICKFGSNFELMRTEPVVYSQTTLNQAIGYISAPSNLGGTELFSPLEAILRTPLRAGAVRNIILLTDGQVTNEPAILNLARRHRGRNRIFSFGIGPACSSFLVKGLARATGGSCEFISRNENIHEKVLRTFARLASPLARDVQIDWGGAEAQTLADFPPVFDGDVLTIFARVLGRLPADVTLKCQTDAGEQSWRVAMPSHATVDGGISTMWARRTIQSLEEVNGVTRSAALGKGSRDREMVIALSKEFGLLSSLTAFVAVEHRSLEERNAGQPATRRVPVMLAPGWGNVTLGGALACAMPMQGDGAKLMAKRRARGTGTKLSLADSASGHRVGEVHEEFELHDSIDSGKPGVFRRLFGSLPANKNRQTSDDTSPRDEGNSQSLGKRPKDSGLSAVLVQQSAAGDFDWTTKLDSIAATVPQWGELSGKLDSAVPAGISDRQKVVGTLRALLLLRIKFAKEQGTWKRAAEKAMRYVSGITGWTAAEVLDWLKAIQSI